MSRILCRITCLLLVLCASFSSLEGDVYQDYEFVFTVLEYEGGGDWYNGISGVRNLIRHIRERTELKIAPKEKVVTLLDDDLFLYPFLFVNGHGNIKFSSEEVRRLRTYLENGGFMFCNDDYGLRESFEKEMKKVFPDKEFREVPFSHPVYHNYYDMPNGLPKIHEHFPGPPKGYGIFYKNRLVVFYAYNADVGDGWEKEHVFNDPPEVREKAIRMGINLVYYPLMH